MCRTRALCVALDSPHSEQVKLVDSFGVSVVLCNGSSVAITSRSESPSDSISIHVFLKGLFCVIFSSETLNSNDRLFAVPK